MISTHFPRVSGFLFAISIALLITTLAATVFVAARSGTTEMPSADSFKTFPTAQTAGWLFRAATKRDLAFVHANLVRNAYV
jgi:hypothetical protein